MALVNGFGSWKTMIFPVLLPCFIMTLLKILIESSPSLVPWHWFCKSLRVYSPCRLNTPSFAEDQVFRGQCPRSLRYSVRRTW
jgi:hypothetical protein